MNAVYELITRGARGPSPQLIYRVGAVLGLFVTALLTLETLTRWPIFPLIGARLYGPASLVLFLLPVVVAAISAVVAARHARRIDWPVLTTTPITRSNVMWGFVRGALFQCRVILGLSLPLLSAVTIGWLQDMVERGYKYSICTGNCYSLIPVSGFVFGWSYSPEVINDCLRGGLLNLLTWASSLAAASIGVYFGLTSRNPIIAITLASLVTLVCLILPGMCVLFSVTDVGGDITLFQFFNVPILNIAGFILFNATRELALRSYWKLPA